MGKHEKFGEGDVRDTHTGGGTPVNVTTNSFCVIMSIVCSLLKNVHMCSLNAALQVRQRALSVHVFTVLTGTGLAFILLM